MPESPEARKARSRNAILTRHRPNGDPERVKAARDYAALSLEDHIQAVVAKAPPFTEEQRDRLRVLLAPAVDQHAYSSGKTSAVRSGTLGTEPPI